LVGWNATPQNGIARDREIVDVIWYDALALARAALRNLSYQSWEFTRQ
jgi:hypothetical protein